MKSRKSNFTAKTCIAELDQLRVGYRKSLRGFRSHLYEMLGQVQRIIIRLRRNEKLRSEFVRAVMKDKQQKSGPGPSKRRKFSLSTEVVCMATGAYTRSTRKVAWKRGRVLNHLRKAGVSVEKTATAIKSRGGIEKIFRETVREDRPNLNKAKGPHGHQVSVGMHKAPVETARQIGSNNREVIVKVWMLLSDRDEIGELPIGSRVTMSAIRVGQKEADFKVSQIDWPDKE